MPDQDPIPASGTTSKDRKPEPRIWNEAEQDSIRAYLLVLAAEMGLGGWDFVVSPHSPAEPDLVDAEVEPVPGRNVAVVLFSENFRSLSRAEKRRVCVHELLHCLVVTMRHLSLDVVSNLGGRKASAVFDIAFTQTEEYIVDTISVAWGDKLPLPRWGGGTVLQVSAELVPGHGSESLSDVLDPAIAQLLAPTLGITGVVPLVDDEPAA